MPGSTCGVPSINLHLPGADAVTSDIPIELPTSPCSLDVDYEQLTRTAYYTHDGKSITFEIVNKQMTLTGLHSTVEEADPIPDNIFKRISKAIFCSCVYRKTRRVRPKSLSAINTA